MAKAMDFSKIRYCDEKDKYIVFGFWRRSLPNIIVPPMILYISFYYFHHAEMFSDHGPFMSLNEIKTNVTYKNSESPSKYNTVYGDVNIYRLDSYINEWKIKILELDPDTDIIIGVDSSNKDHIDANFADKRVNEIPSFYAINRNAIVCRNKMDRKTVVMDNSVHWGMPKGLNVGDIVTMKISPCIHDWKIEYFVNDDELIKIKKVRKTVLGYRLAIAMNGNGSVEIISYSST